MAIWYPDAVINRAVKSGGSFIDGVPFRGVLHTTEGRSFRPREDSYGGWHTAYPHFTLLEHDGGITIFQHLPINVAARALKNKRGGVQTNRARAIQIELVGRAAESPNFSEQMLTAISSWMRWVEAEAGVQPIAPLEFIGGDGHGEDAPSRMSKSEWMAFAGWCGHQHVPENDHWDPGRINIGRLLMTAATPTLDTDSSVDVPTATDLQYRVVNVRADDVLNVRDIPGTSGKIVCRLAADADSLAIGPDPVRLNGSDWVPVIVGSVEEGWVNSRYLAPFEGSSLFRVVNVPDDDVLNVRVAAGVGEELVGALQPGARDVRRSGRADVVESAVWWELIAPTAGWVHSAFLENQDTEGTGRGPVEEGVQNDEIDHGSVESEWTD